MKQGQKITLTDQWRKGATIFHVVGKKPREIQGLAMYWEKAYADGKQVGELEPTPATWLDVLYLTHRWFCRADGRRPPTQEEWEQAIWKRDFDAKPSGIPGLDDDPVPAEIERASA